MDKFDYINDQDVIKRMIVENKHAFAFVGQMPITPGHCLICPKRPVKRSADLTVEEWVDIIELKKICCEKLRNVEGAEGFNFAWNEEKLAGQSVPHFHLHIVPRKEGDSGVDHREVRSFFYRPDIQREIASSEELYRMAEQLRTVN